jgi:hypothetical protein
MDLQDIVQTTDPTVRVMRLALKTQFLGNAETRALQLDTELRTLEQGDLSVGDYCRKMRARPMRFTSSGTVPEHVSVLNVVRGLPSCYEALRTLITHQRPPPTFLEVRDALTLEKLTRGLDTPASTTSTTSRALIAAPPPSSASPPASLLGAPPPGRAGVGAVGAATAAEDAVVGVVERPPRLRPLAPLSTVGLILPIGTEWITDSGASYHTTPDAGIHSSVRPPHPSCPSSIMVGDGSCLPVTSVGSAHGPFRLSDVFVAP